MVYVCDRSNNRIQVFKKDGTFVKEGDRLEDDDAASGSVWDIAFSNDPQQRTSSSPTATTRRSSSSTATRSRSSASFGDGGR